MGYIEGAAREQVVLFPATLDDYIAPTSMVRAVGALVESLEVTALGFVRAEAKETGRPGYDPRMMLGIYVWGYLNKIRSSRQLERECGRNVELMWLTGNLQPDFKTIANFRKENTAALKGVLAQFWRWCLEEGLYGKEEVAIDGSKFEAVNANHRNYTREGVKKRLAALEAEAEKYLQEAAKADEAEEGGERKWTAEELKEKTRKLQERLKRYRDRLQEMDQKGVDQLSLTDPAARRMATGRGSDVCYNVQVAVDSQNKLIVAFEMSNAVADQKQLAGMAQKAKTALGVEKLRGLADAGYFDEGNLKACEDAGIETYVPVPYLDRGEKQGRFAREAFIYHEENDVYVCPQGEELSRRSQRTHANGRVANTYTTKACRDCPVRDRCTPSRTGKRIERSVHEDVMVRQRERNRQHPEMVDRRKAIVEHPFGTIKRAMGQSYFLLRGKEKVEAEFSLTTVCYNFKRVLTLWGMEKLLAFLRAKMRASMGACQMQMA